MPPQPSQRAELCTKGRSWFASQKGQIKGRNPVLKASSISSSSQISPGFEPNVSTEQMRPPSLKNTALCKSWPRVVLSDRLGLAPLTMPQGIERDIAQMDDLPHPEERFFSRRFCVGGAIGFADDPDLQSSYLPVES
jgi:hypothetical protein